MAAVIVGVAKVVGAIIGAVKSIGIVSTIAKFVVTTALSIGVSKLIAKRAMTSADAGGDGGGRIQLPPATDNKIPVVYGGAFIGGSIVDAMLSTDQKTMWYVVALAEHSDDQGGGGGNYTFDTTACYYDGKLIEFGSNGAVTSLITNNANPLTAQKDTRVNGYLYVYLFTNGSTSCQNASLTAYQILSTANGVPSGQQWTAGQQDMPNCAFAIIKVIYNTNAGVTSAGSLTARMVNSITRPGDVILDYMLNTRYGCAIPLDRIDTVSLDALNDYSDELINYIPTSGFGYDQQARYRVNGPIDTSQNCLDNLQRLVDTCDSWLQYSELTGLWRVVMNKGYDQAPNAQTINDLFLVDSSNLVGGIDISPLDLNETYNQIEVAYPNTYIKDQTDYQVIDLFTEDPQILSENEAVNRLNITLPCVNNAVQAKYLASRRIYQSREDLVVTFRLDFSGIQIEAGDVIRINHEVYGWTNKLFRVSTVAEEKDETGNLFAVVQAFEYNNDIYDDIIQDFRPSFNTGLLNPNVIDVPGTPTATVNPDTDGMVSSFTLSSYVPNFGTVLYMDFNYGNSSNIQTHQLYRKVQTADGLPFVNSDTGNAVYNNVSIAINDLPAGTYYFSTVARNDIAGRVSLSSNSFFWTGANINPANIVTGTGVYSNGNMLYSNVAFSNLTVNANVYLTAGVGQLANNTYITNVANSTHFFVTPTPIVALSNANIEIISGGINGNVITPNTLPGNRVIANTLNGNSIITGTLNGNVIVNGTVTDLQIGVHTITANNIKANAIVANTIAAGAITTDKLAANSITANKIVANAITSDKIFANAVTSDKINANSITSDKILANAITSDKIFANAITSVKISADAITAGKIAANAVTAGTIAAGAITAGSLAAGSVTANEIAAGAITTSKLDAFAVTAGKIQSGAITATQIAANTILFENLAIGAVTQAKSTISDPIVTPIPFTNISGLWPANTRCIVPAGGVSIIPSTDPNSSANTEYVEGSRIEVGFSVKFYVNPGGANYDYYNLVEVWKSGASNVFDRGFNTLRHSYIYNTTGSARTQTLHAYGFGQLDLYSADGGNTWNVFNSSANAVTITGAVNVNLGNNIANLGTTFSSYLQTNPNVAGGPYSAGVRQEQNTSVSPVTLNQQLYNSGVSFKASWNAMEFMPYTGGNGYSNSYPERIAVGTNGTLWYSTAGWDTQPGVIESTNTLKNLFGVYGGVPTSGTYTAIAVGQSGTVIKSTRSINSSGNWSPKSTYILGNTSNPVLSSLYSIASDDTVASAPSKWVSVGQYGMIQVSIDDGETWTQVSSPTPNDLLGVRYGNNKWIAVGKAGTILLNTGNIQVANDWIQVDTSNLNYVNGTNYGNIQSRILSTIDYSPVWNTFNVGGQGIILNFPSGNNTPRVANVFAPSESLNLTRLTYWGSWPSVSNVSLPPAEQRVLNNQIFSATVLDTGYVQGQETSYYLVIGNLAGQQIQAGQIYLQVTEIKR